MLELGSQQANEKMPQPAAALLGWYDRHRRDLPWRAPPGALADPYHVWLSEIMLQQTTVPAVKPYFRKFLALWPRVEALAAAEREAVLAAWAGLGYYSRARNLHLCAETVVTRFGGEFPAEEAELLLLPGIGPYTAAAISAIAFGRRAVVIDGNVERVVARYAAIDTPLPAARPLIRRAADQQTPDSRPGDYAQAMMDLGATVCTPRNPACGFCPLSDGCQARARGIAAGLPVKPAKLAKPVRRGLAFVVRDPEGRLLVRTRADKGLLGGMTEVPGSDWAETPPPPASAAPLVAEWQDMGSITHIFTHFRLELQVFAATLARRAAAPEGMRWIDADAIADAALPNLMRKVLARAGG